MKSRVGIAALVLGATMSLNVGLLKQGLQKGTIFLNPIQWLDRVSSSHQEAVKESVELSECLNCIGRLEIEKMAQPYEVVQGNDNQFYLDHDTQGQRNVYGSIFLDYRNKLDDKVLFVYGHHMSDGEMFAKLINYEDITYLENHRAVRFLDEEWRVEAVGQFKGDLNHDLFIKGYNDILNKEHLERYVQYLEEGLEKKLHINTDKQLLILSTCFDLESDERYLVVIEKV